MLLAVGKGWDPAAAAAALQGQSFAFKYFAAAYRAATARVYAHPGMLQQPLGLLHTLVRPLELAPAWAPNFPRMACDAASALWLLNRADEIEVIERNIRQNENGDRRRAAALLEAAITEFRALGMSGWLRRGETLSS